MGAYVVVVVVVVTTLYTALARTRRGPVRRIHTLLCSRKVQGRAMDVDLKTSSLTAAGWLRETARMKDKVGQ